MLSVLHLIWNSTINDDPQQISRKLNQVLIKYCIHQRKIPSNADSTIIAEILLDNQLFKLAMSSQMISLFTTSICQKSNYVNSRTKDKTMNRWTFIDLGPREVESESRR